MRAGRDSKRVIDTPCFARGASNWYTAPALFGTASTSEVWSLPDGAVCKVPTTAKRVRLCGSSWIWPLTTPSLYCAPASSLAIAATVPSSPAMRAASAFEATAWRAMCG